MNAFLITIDTEGDNLWQQPREITTKNAAFLPRFQSLCERYGFKPTYLTNYEMAQSEQFVEFGKDVQSRGTGEIGMHLHAWNSPPLISLTSDDLKYQPFLIDYSESIMRDKIAFMTDLLEDKFETKMISHRAGRWSFNDVYARLLIEQGYCVDCSVTPHVSWKTTLGDPNGRGGTDFSQCPETAYFFDLKNRLLELPMTIIKYDRSQLIQRLSKLPKIGKVIRYRYPQRTWLRPNGHNLKPMLKLVKQAAVEKRPYIEFMIHSSEFMPGGSPNFVNESQIEKLYTDMEHLFAIIQQQGFVGMTLKEYYLKEQHLLKFT
jgi:hypothetical protein